MPARWLWNTHFQSIYEETEDPAGWTTSIPIALPVNQSLQRIIFRAGFTGSCVSIGSKTALPIPAAGYLHTTLDVYYATDPPETVYDKCSPLVWSSFIWERAAAAQYYAAGCAHIGQPPEVDMIVRRAKAVETGHQMTIRQTFSFLWEGYPSGSNVQRVGLVGKSSLWYLTSF